MSAIAIAMPNEGHLGGFDIRRFIRKYMSIGLATSVGVHVLAIGTYYLVAYLTISEAQTYREVPVDPTKLAPPPSIAPPELPQMLNILSQLQTTIASIPKPVVTDVAPEELPIADQKQIADHLNAIGDDLSDIGTRGQIEIRATIPDEKPDISQTPGFVAFEQEPQPVKRVEPVYPEIAAMAEVNGSVTVQFYVDKRGNVGTILISEVDPKGMGFEEAAMEAIAQWKFTPALQRENPVGVWMTNKFSFKIK